MRIRMTPPPAYFRTFEKFPDQLDRETLATFEPRRIAMAGPLADLRVAVAKMASENNDRVQKARDAHGEFLKKVEMKVDSSIDLSHASTPAVPPAPHSKG